MKKQYKKIHYFLLTALIIISCGCKKFLQEKIYTEYDPSTFTATESGIQLILTGGYSEETMIEYNMRDYFYLMNEFPTDEMDDANGGLYASAALFMQFKWDATNTTTSAQYSRMYEAVRDANILLDNIKSVTSLSESKLAEYTAEARFIRAEAYSVLYYSFGPTPLITSSQVVNLQPARTTDDSMQQFIATELAGAANDLPVTPRLIGTASKGSALGVLCKFYLNTKQWQKCSDVADQIIGLNAYKLFPDITRLFAVQNNHNSEYLYAYPCVTSPAGYGNIIMAHSFPLNYPILSNWVNFGTKFHILTPVVNSFNSSDRRLSMIDTIYKNIAGQTVRLNTDAQGNPLNMSASFKFIPDSSSLGVDMGNYVPIVRYADILLSKAEALNNLDGPNAVSFNLIDSVRNRAGLPNLDQSRYTSTQSLNDAILQERQWEFYGEGLRRQDLIRMGKYISSAQARGINAQSYQELYPIPQSEIQSNPNLVQNKGY